MPQFLRLDLFPAKVKVVSSDSVMTLATTRVVVTNDEAFVYADGASGVEERYSGRLEDFSGDVKQGWVVVLHDGTTLNVTRSGGCGCGSRLRGFRAFPGVPYVTQHH